MHYAVEGHKEPKHAAATEAAAGAAASKPSNGTPSQTEEASRPAAPAAPAVTAASAKLRGAPGGRPPPPDNRRLKRFGSVIDVINLGDGASVQAAAAAARAKAAEASVTLLPSEPVRRHAYLIASFWAGMTLALKVVESLVMQLTGFGIFVSEDMEEAAMGFSVQLGLSSA